MGDKEARALGASTTVEIKGKTYKVAPITMGRLQELQREAVNWYKRQVISTYAENMDLLGELGEQLLQKKLHEVSTWDVDDLPKRKSYNVSLIKITKDLKKRIAEAIPEADAEDDEQWKALLASALDQEAITPDEVKQIAGRRPLSVPIAYDSWWVTGCYDGMIALIYASMDREQDVTKEEIANWPISEIAAVARVVESITAPNLGNT